MAGTNLTAEKLRAVLDYDPTTGIFSWLRPSCSHDKVGQKAGRNSGIQSQISIHGTRYLCARLAWLHVYGEWPTPLVDHINGNRWDNRIINLRCADHRTNLENQRRPMVTNTTGFLGVTKHGARYRAKIGVNKKRVHLGCFDTKHDAYDAYLKAKRRLHKGCTI